MPKYRCVIWSNSSLGREYEVETTSACKAAMKYGRCEFGEVVEIHRKRTNQLLSRAEWSPELHNYYNCYIPIRRVIYEYQH